MKSDSDKIKISQWEIAQFLFLHKRKNWLILSLIVFLSILITGVVLEDVRVIILSLMLLFIVIPMLYSFIFIKDMLHPDIAFNTLPHTFSIDRESGILSVTVFSKPVQDQVDTAPEDTDYTTDSHDSRDIVEEISFIKEIPLESVGIPYLGLNSAIYPVSDTGMIFVPLKSDVYPLEIISDNGK